MKTSTKKSLQMLFIACLGMVILWWLGEREFIEKASSIGVGTIPTILIIIMMTLFAIASGIVEAILWSKLGVMATKWNEHIFIVFQRGLMFLIFLLAAYFDYSPKTIWLILTYSILSYPYFHDGAYYWFRNVIDNKVYPRRWKDNSTTSTAIIEINYKTRVIFLILGLISLLLIVL